MKIYKGINKNNLNSIMIRPTELSVDLSKWMEIPFSNYFKEEIELSYLIPG
jgi:hypothetical protein